MEETWFVLDEDTDEAPEEVGVEVWDPASAAGFETKLRGRIDEAPAKAPDEVREGVSR